MASGPPMDTVRGAGNSGGLGGGAGVECLWILTLGGGRSCPREGPRGDQSALAVLPQGTGIFRDGARPCCPVQPPLTLVVKEAVFP